MDPGRSFSRSTALVTGASSGVGAELARELSRRGASRIVLVARRRDRLEALADEIGPAARVVVADLTRPEDQERVAATEPCIDVLVNNAGAGLSEPVVETARREPGRLSEMVDLNCRAMVRLTAAWAPDMVRRGRGWILNVGSVAGMFPTPTAAVYGATKAFVASFTESLRMELRGTGVSVLLLAPGPMATEFHDDDEVLDTSHGPFWMPPEHVARAGLDALLADRPRLIPGWRVRAAAMLGSAAPMMLFRPVAAATLRRRRRREARP